MDMSSTSWFTELELEDPVFADRCDNMMDSVSEEFTAILGDDFQILPENGSLPLLPPLAVVEHPQNPNVTNFVQSVPTMDLRYKLSQPRVDLNQLSNGVAKVRKGVQKASPRAKASQSSYDHTIAERKRREQLSHCFVALSAIVPGLKKMDKSSILGDAVKYLKQLQEKVKILEEKARRHTIESVVLVKHSQLIMEDDNESDNMDEGGGSGNSLPEIDARLCDKSILIRIHCENHKGVMIRILSQIEKMNLLVVNTSVSRFGTIGAHITIIAEMEQEFNATLNDILTSLRSIFRRQECRYGL